MDGRAEGAAAIKQEDHASGHWHNFPAGLRLLVVDDDPLCLKVVEQMLRKCSYEVTTCTNATMALNLLRDKSIEYDLVLSDVYMPDMDGFKLLEVVGLEMDLPVIMMSSNGDTSNVLRGVTHGACDYLIKPVRLEELRNLWQHVVRRRRQLNLELDSDEQSQERDEDQGRNKRKADAAGFMSDQLRMMNASAGGNGGSANGGQAGASGAGGLGAADDLGLENGANKKARVVWSVEMHQQFVNAVNQLGIDKAVPKKILEIMNVDGLTRENVASHLQKYRLYLKRVSGVQAPSGQARPARPSPPQPQSPPAPSQQPQQQQHLPVGAAGTAAAGAAAGPAGPLQGGGAAAAAGLAGLLGSGSAGAPPGGGPVGADGGGPGPGLNSAVANAMNAAAAAAAAGGFTGHPPPPHPAALLAANPMMAAAAGLNPLLGAMGGLGVGPLGPINPLNGMPMPGMQPPLGLLPGLPGPGGQPGLGPLGHMGLPGLGSLPNLPGGLSLNSMANGLQHMAAANLMQGMAAGMGQLPALAMNGLMGPMPGVGLPGPQQHVFPQAQQLQQQLQQQQKDIQMAQKQQQQQQAAAAAAVAAAAAAAAQPHTADAAAAAQSQQPGLSQAGSGTPSLASPAPQVLQQPHPHALASPSPHLNQNPQSQQPTPQQQLQTQHNAHLGSGNSVAAAVAAGLNGAVDANGRGHLHAPGLQGPQAVVGHGVAGDGVLDLTPELVGGLIEDGFGAAPGGAGQVTHGAAAVLDPAMLLDEGDNLDLAAVYHEMYNSGGNNGGGGGGAITIGIGQGLLGPPPMIDAAMGLVGGPDAGRLGVGDDDFLNFLLKN